MFFARIRKWADFIKFSHTVFALPFALASMAVAARDQHGWPGWRIFLLILAAMFCARTCAMSFNRIADAEFDRAIRARPRGICLRGGFRWRRHGGCVWRAAGGLVAVSYLHQRVCLSLSPVAIFVVAFIR